MAVTVGRLRLPNGKVERLQSFVFPQGRRRPVLSRQLPAVSTVWPDNLVKRAENLVQHLHHPLGRSVRDSEGFLNFLERNTLMPRPGHLGEVTEIPRFFERHRFSPLASMTVFDTLETYSSYA